MTRPIWRHESEKPEIIRTAEQFVGSTEVDRVAIVMMNAWGNVDLTSSVSQHPVSYVANFADMARDVLEYLAEQHLLRPQPWPPIPYPDNAAHQARWTIQRAYEPAKWRTGDHSEGLIAAVDALLAEGWLPPSAPEARPPAYPRASERCDECGTDVTAWNPVTGAITCRQCHPDRSGEK
jgi:hypothetical protein